MMEVWPNSRNVIPGKVFLTVDFRHPDDDRLSSMDRNMRAVCGGLAKDGGVEVEIEQIWYSPPIEFDDACIGTVRSAAERHGYAHRDIVSGAGHDACNVSRIAPTGMIFVPCKDGISHAEIESASPEDLAAGCQVLLDAVLERANAVPTG